MSLKWYTIHGWHSSQAKEEKNYVFQVTLCDSWRAMNIIMHVENVLTRVVYVRLRSVKSFSLAEIFYELEIYRPHPYLRFPGSICVLGRSSNCPETVKSKHWSFPLPTSSNPSNECIQAWTDTWIPKIIKDRIYYCTHKGGWWNMKIL